VRVIMQSEAGECGLACLAMVADAHGLRTTLPELRGRFPMSLKGARLAQLIDIAQRMGFLTRALRLEPEALDRLRLPCVLHWDHNHFVVLRSIGRQRAEIADPARGQRSISIDELSKHFTGVALELSPAADFTPRAVLPRLRLRQLTGPMRGLGRSLALIAALSLALQCFVLIGPFFLQWVVDQVLVSADRQLLVVLGIGFLLLLAMQVGIGLLRGWAVVHLSSQLGLQWGMNVFSHLLRLPLDFFEKRHMGDIASRMSSVQTIQKTLTTSFVEALIDGVMALATFAMMLVYSVRLAMVTLAAVALYLGLRAATFGAMRDRSERQLVAAAKQQTHLIESLRGIQSVKVCGAEPLRRDTYGNLMADTINQDVWLARLGLGFGSGSQLIFGAEKIAVIWIGAVLAMNSVFSVGMLIAYLAYKDQFAQRIAGLIDKWVEFRMLRLHAERVSDIALAAPDDADGQIEATYPDALPIVVEGLSFRYADGEPWVLKDCGFSIAPGESLAIVGASGSGKTTLLKLMLGLLAPTEGAISIGGRDIRKSGMRGLRERMGAVMQDDQLFAGSVADNIRGFSTDIDLDAVRRAAKLAAIDDEIERMPMGYHTLIGDMGSTLSGGQKQRVILARALCRTPDLLFLDEATSHLDGANEKLVNDAVRALGLTKIIVAHRAETIASADRVLVLEGGRVRSRNVAVESENES